jgi:hypothetical protein
LAGAAGGGAAKAAGGSAKPAATAAAMAATGDISGGGVLAGSTVTLRQVATATSVSKSFEPTWNPYFAEVLTLAPIINLSPKWFIRGSLSATHELTESDWTTYDRETMLSDTIMALVHRAYRNRALGIGINADVQLSLPTSKASQARTMMAGTAIGLSANWRKGPLIVSWSGRGTYLWHRYTTGELERPWLPGCQAGNTACDPYINSGVRNPQVRIGNLGALNWTVNDWLSLNLIGAVFNDFLYPGSTAPTRDGIAVPARADSVNMRASMYYNVSADIMPHPAWVISVGADTFNAQLAPDSTYRSPFFNRFTTVYVDVTVFPMQLIH